MLKMLQYYLRSRAICKQKDWIGFLDEKHALRPDATILTKITTSAFVPPYKTMTVIAESKLSLEERTYMIIGNRKENDDNWKNEAWAGKASMSLHHKFLI